MKTFVQQSFNVVCLSCALGITGFFLLGSKSVGKTPVEAEFQKITLKTLDGKSCMILDASSGVARIKFVDKKGETNLEISGGDTPSLVVRNAQSKEVIQIALLEEGNSVVNLKDAQGISRIQLQGGQMPAIFLKNPQNEVIGTLLTLQDGGAALGLADKEGDVAAFLRGGSTPSISFFQKSVEPLAAMGISQKVPHLLISSPLTKDNLVIHGGDPASVLFVDEQGDIPVLLSKHGLFQGKKPSASSEPAAPDEKVFTWGDLLNSLKDIDLNKR
ncbi:MAG: hypothetical protein WCG10_01800 [Chlamydiota bacterium]